MITQNRPELTWFEHISGIYLKTKKLTEDVIKPYNLTWPQYGALLALVSIEPPSQRELADILQIDTTNAMVICDSLEKKNLIIRQRDPNDRRVNRLHVTKEGHQAFASSNQDVMAKYGLIESSVSREELESISIVLSRIHSVITNILVESSRR